jgi:assimilatory nitrate reductase catalytic subunit
MTAVATTCPYCGVGCGVVIDGGTVRGDASHPSNRGRLCSKGAALADTLDDRARLHDPLVDGAVAAWDTALDLVARRFAETIARHGPDSVAFYVSGQCLTEDYYVANKLMKGFIGSANIDSNSRLCMASSVAGHVRAFGEDVVPGIYEDWDEADLVVFVGSNAAWCHPVLHQRVLAARAARGTKIVVIDPRRTATAELADLHLPLGPGTDVMLFNGLLVHLADAGRLDRAWLERHAEGLAGALHAARGDAPDSEAVARECGLDPEAVDIFYEWFARTERVLTVYSQGVNQSSAGTDKVNAIINCHLATGRIGRPGMGPFSITGQPNAMGGREVGGLANQLAAHLRFDDPADRAALAAFWGAPSLARKPGLKAVELFEAVMDGRVRAIWIMATNPADSMPRAGRVREALRACPFVVVSDCWQTDTTELAHVVLPATAWGEKDGTVTSSERRISRQRPHRAPLGQARPDWWQMAQVASRMGFGAAFAWNGPAAVFREHAALSGHANAGRRLFDISALATLDDAAYDTLRPVRWPLPAQAPGEGARLFADGGFATPDKRARLVATPYLGRPGRGDAPFLLNTGRVRDQWHTMTRTGLAPALMAHTPEPLLAINPIDAAPLGLADGDLARVTTYDGHAVLRVSLSHAQRHGELYAHMHWTDGFSSAGPVARLVSARADPLSGQPELKATRARLARVEAHFHGVLLRQDATQLSRVCHWSRVPAERGHIYHLTGLRPVETNAHLRRLATLLLPECPEADVLEMADARRGILRVALVAQSRLLACLFLAPARAQLPRTDALADLLGAPLSASARMNLLAGGQPQADEDTSPRVCACFGVSRAAIRHAVVTNRLRSPAQVGDALKAGTGCGSCVPEIAALIRELSVPA